MLLATQQSVLLGASPSTSLYLLLEEDKELMQAGGQEGLQGQTPMVGRVLMGFRRWNPLHIH